MVIVLNIYEGRRLVIAAICLLDNLLLPTTYFLFPRLLREKSYTVVSSASDSFSTTGHGLRGLFSSKNILEIDSPLFVNSRKMKSRCPSRRDVYPSVCHSRLLIRSAGLHLVKKMVLTYMEDIKIMNHYTPPILRFPLSGNNRQHKFS